jgi:hypothetical protein
MSPDAIEVRSGELFRKRLCRNAEVLVSKARPAVTERHRGILIGNIGFDYLLLGGFASRPFGQGDAVSVRTLIEGQSVGFQTSIAKITDDPTIYLARFPLDVEIFNVRKAHRIQAFFPAEVAVAAPAWEGDRILPSRILDINAGGCRLRSRRGPPKNAEVAITFALPGAPGPHAGWGVVLDCKAARWVFDSRMIFIREERNLPMLRGVEAWVNDNLMLALAG